MAETEKGGKTGEMREMAKLFTRNAGKLNEIIKDLNGRTVNSNDIWKGPAADRFRSEWNDARSSFQEMHQALNDAGKAVNKHASNIDEISR
jgi:WXG100 family type VII secretion target